MNNVVAINPASARLETIVSDIAIKSTRMVVDAHSTGTLLNEARELLGGDDAAFGAWRVEFIEPLGISKRVAQQMQRLARSFTKDTLPKLNLSVLYMIASDSVGPMAQAALCDLAEAKADAGEVLSHYDCSSLVSRISQGRATHTDVSNEAAAIRQANDVVIEGEVSEALGTPEDQDRAATEQDRAPAGNGNGQSFDEQMLEATEWAANIRAHMKRQSKSKQQMMLVALLNQLRRAKLFEVEGETSVMVRNNGKPAIVVGT